MGKRDRLCAESAFAEQAMAVGGEHISAQFVPRKRPIIFNFQPVPAKRPVGPENGVEQVSFPLSPSSLFLSSKRLHYTRLLGKWVYCPPVISPQVLGNG